MRVARGSVYVAVGVELFLVYIVRQFAGDVRIMVNFEVEVEVVVFEFSEVVLDFYVLGHVHGNKFA